MRSAYLDGKSSVFRGVASRPSSRLSGRLMCVRSIGIPERAEAPPFEPTAELRYGTDVGDDEVHEGQSLQGFLARRHDAVLAEPATIRPVGSSPPATRACNRDERYERPEPQVLRQASRTPFPSGEPAAVEPLRTKERLRPVTGGMPDDDVRGEREGRTRSNSPLDEVEVAELGDVLLEAAEAIEELPPQRRGWRSLPSRCGPGVRGPSRCPCRAVSRLCGAEVGRTGSGRRPRHRSRARARPRSSQSGTGTQSASQKASTGERDMRTARFRAASSCAAHRERRGSSRTAISPNHSREPSVDPSSATTSSNSRRGRV